MKITFLGTGTSQGVPVIACPCEVCKSSDEKDKRLRTSVLVEIDELSLVIDTGPDFRQQMLRANVKRIDAVLFTHEHKDHIAGLDDIRAFNFVQQQAIPVYAEERVQESIKREFSYVFAEEKYPGIPQIEFVTIHNRPFTIKNECIVPIRAMHHKLPVLGYRFRNFAYLTDVNGIPTREKDKIKNVDYLVINGLRHEKHISHYNLSEAVDLIKEVNAKHGFVTHISHQMGFHKVNQKLMPSNIQLAYDGMVLEV